MGVIDKIRKDKSLLPPRLIVCGQPAVGKTTFASQFPSPLFVDLEGRTGHLGVARLETQEWGELMEAMREVLAMAKAGNCEYKTLVIDSLDHAELALHRHICKEKGVQSIEDFGYGKGFAFALDEWQRFAKGAELLRAAGLWVIMTAHTAVKTYKNPAGADYDRYCLKMNGKAADYLVERADLVGFAHFQEYLRESKDLGGKAKASSTGQRVMTFSHNPAFVTKKGVPVADEIPLDYQAFREALVAGKEPEAKAA